MNLGGPSGTLVALGLAGIPAGALAQAAPVDWVQQYEQQQAIDAYESLMACWMKQWPGGVKSFDGPAAAGTQDIAAAADATRANCPVEIGFYLSQVKVDLARQGMTPNDIESAAMPAVHQAIDGMFDEYWSRL